MTPKNRKPSILDCKKPWAENDNSIWLASTLQLNRNIDNFLFPGKLNLEKRKQILTLISKGLEKLPQLSSPELLKAEEMEAIEKEYIFEHYLSMQNLHHAQESEGFVIDSSGEFLAVLNISDHLKLQISDFQGEIEKSWKKLVGLETALGNNLSYAYNPKFGFLTADATICGTALIVFAFLHLPGLIHTGQLNSTLEKNLAEGIVTTGLQGDPGNIIGDVVVFHNQYTLGLTEEDILSSLRTSLTKIFVSEKNARQTIRNSQNTSILDKVSRAYGVLLHSYQIETIEAMNSISLLKLALDLEWFKGITHRDLNEIFFNCRRAHLIACYPRDLEPESLPHKRAEIIHAALKPSSLLI